MNKKIVSTSYYTQIYEKRGFQKSKNNFLIRQKFQFNGRKPRTWVIKDKE